MRHAQIVIVVAIASLAQGCFLDAFGVADGGGASTGGSNQGGGPLGGGPDDGGADEGGAGADGGGANDGGGGATTGCEAGFVCAPPTPTGEIVAAAAGEVACPADYGSAVVVGNGLDPGCGDCSCSMPGGGTCTPGTESGYNDGACASAIGSIDLSDMQCFSLPGSAGSVDGHRLAPSIASAASCAPGPADPAPISKQTVCTLTSNSAGACGTGGSCIPEPAAPFDQLCNLLPEGESTCAAGWTATVTTQAVLGDTRSCSCSCTETSPPSCPDAALLLFNSTSCGGTAVATLPADGACHDTSAFSAHDSELVDAGTWTAGTCSGQPSEIGSIEWGPARILCCLDP